MGKRLVTLTTCQWADMPFDELCELASSTAWLVSSSSMRLSSLATTIPAGSPCKQTISSFT